MVAYVKLRVGLFVCWKFVFCPSTAIAGLKTDDESKYKSRKLLYNYYC